MQDETLRPTMRMIAERAGVSHMTVSLALRNSPSVKETTRDKVLRVADELGYRPDPVTAKVMSRLRHRHNSGHVLAYLTHFKTDDWTQHPVYGATYKGARDRAATLGYRLDVFVMGQDGVSSRNLPRILYTRAIDGLIIGSIERATGHLSMNLDRLSSIVLGYSIKRPQLHRVANHQLHSILLALRKLSKFGNKRIGLVLPEQLNRKGENNWATGYLMFQTALPKSRRVRLLAPLRITFDVFRDWFRQERPDAIVGLADDVPDYLRKMGVKVPEQVQFATLDRKPHETHLAGVYQHHYHSGVICVDLLLSQIYSSEQGIPNVPRTVLIEGSWLDGPTAMRRSLDAFSLGKFRKPIRAPAKSSR